MSASPALRPTVSAMSATTRSAFGDDLGDPEKHALGLRPDGWIPVFPRDKREAFARRSCSIKKVERDAPSRSRSTGSGVAIGKAARQNEPHACAAGAGDQFKPRAATGGAASHVAQAARRLPHGGGGAVRGEGKPLAVIRDGDAARTGA